MPDNLTDRLDAVPGGPDPDDDEYEPPLRPAEPKRQSATRAAMEWIVAIGVAVLAAIAIKTFLVQAFVIPTGSMIPTLLEGDRVLVRKGGFDVSDVQRGDIVVFKNPNRIPSEPAHLIKRVMGLPGDVLEARDGVLYVNGEAKVEPYLKPGVRTLNLPRTTVEPGHLFMMGDNRENSLDSRDSRKGQIPEDTLVGEAFFRLWPLDRLDGL